MTFQRMIEQRFASRIAVNKIRAKSLVIASKEAIQTAKEIPIKDEKLKSIIRELYEGLRQFCEAIGYTKGFKFNNHEVIADFLKDELKEPSLALKFDKYRRIRNGVNYYGDAIPVESVKEALNEIPTMIKTLEKHYPTNG